MKPFHSIILVSAVMLLGAGCASAPPSIPSAQAPAAPAVGAPAPTPEPSAPAAAVPPDVPAPNALPPSAPAAAVSTLEIGASGFSPAQISVQVGSTLRILNSDSAPHWPESGIHPTHLVCPELNIPQPLQSGESYSVTFSQAKDCPIHDHLNPSTVASITVR